MKYMPQRTKTLGIRLSDYEHDEIAQLAATAGHEHLSSFVREVLLSQIPPDQYVGVVIRRATRTEIIALGREMYLLLDTLSHNARLTMAMNDVAANENEKTKKLPEKSGALIETFLKLETRLRILRRRITSR